MRLKVHLIRVFTCLGFAVLAGILAWGLSARMTPAPPPADTSAMDEALKLATDLVLNRAELTLRTVDLQSLLVQEATSGQCSSGARFLLRQAMIENAIVRYAALMRDGRLSCQPGNEDDSLIEVAVAQLSPDVELALIGPEQSGRDREVALVRFKEEGFASVFWFPVDRLLADPLRGDNGSPLMVQILSADGVLLAQSAVTPQPDDIVLTYRADSESYPLSASVSAAQLILPRAPVPSPLWPIGFAVLAAILPLAWWPRFAKTEDQADT